MSIAIVEEVVRKLGGEKVLRRVVRSQADLAWPFAAGCRFRH